MSNQLMDPSGTMETSLSSHPSPIPSPLHPRSDPRKAAKRRHIHEQVAALLRDVWPWRYLSVALSFFAILSILYLLYFGFEDRAFNSLWSRSNVTDYGLVVDAGSHGSRLHLYGWPARIHDPEHPLTGPVTYPTELWAVKTAPGISSMAAAGQDPERAGEVCLRPLIFAAKKALKELKIDQETWSTFPIFLKATAGMREVDQLTRARIMNSLRRFLANKTESPFAFKWNWARVIAGEEEGVYGWLTANHALNSITNQSHETVGALDMGGASLQITFSPVHTSVMENYHGLNLGGQTIRLYSRSFLSFGWGDAMMRLTTGLAVESVIAALKAENFPMSSTEELMSHLFGVAYLSKSKSAARGKSIEDVGSAARADGDEVIQTLNLTAVHPCYPVGHEMEFTLPSLVYPEGRFYVDFDLKHLLYYMRASGIPDDYLNRVSQGRWSPYNMKSSKSTNDMKRRLSAVSTVTNAQTVAADSAAVYMLSNDLGAESGPPTSQLEWVARDEEEENAAGADFGVVDKGGDAESVKAEGEGRRPPLRGTSGPAISSLDAQSRNLKASARSTPRFADYDPKILKTKRSRHPFEPFDFPLPQEVAPRVRWIVKFRGGSDFKQCRQRARDLFYDEPCFVHSCSFNGVYQPRMEDSKFIAFGQFSKVRMALNVSSNASPEELEEAAEKVCSKSREDLRATRRWNKSAYRPYGKHGVLNLCWKSIWAHTILSWGFQFAPSSRNIEFAESLGEGDANNLGVGWAMGSMIFEANSFPWKSPLGRFELPFVWAAIATVCLLLLSLSLLAQIRQVEKALKISGLMATAHRVCRENEEDRRASDVTQAEGLAGNYHAL